MFNVLVIINYSFPPIWNIPAIFVYSTLRGTLCLWTYLTYYMYNNYLVACLKIGQTIFDFNLKLKTYDYYLNYAY